MSQYSFSYSYWFQILYVGGYAMSVIFMTYVISFIYRKGRKNSGLWSLCFYIVSIFTVFIFVMELSTNTLKISLVGIR
jgi:ATP-binding cassette subfamily A (ABC1) protein 8